MEAFKFCRTLNDIFNKAGSNAHIRVFCNCQTIFDGRRSCVSKKEWNLNVRPYLECNVIKDIMSDGVIIVAI